MFFEAFRCFFLVSSFKFFVLMLDEGVFGLMEQVVFEAGRVRDCFR